MTSSPPKADLDILRPRQDSNTSSSFPFSLKSVFSRADSGVSTTSSTGSITSNLSARECRQDSIISTDSAHSSSSLDSRISESALVFKRCDSESSSRRISEISLPTVAEDDDDDESFTSYSHSSSPSQVSLTRTPPASPKSFKSAKSSTSSSARSPENVETAYTGRVRKVSNSLPGKNMFELSLSKLLSIKTDVVQGFRRRVRSEGMNTSSEEEDLSVDNMDAKEEPQLTVPEEFYISLIQTCLHSLGRRGDTAGHNPLQMASHIQKIFGVPNSIHGEILKDQLNKPPEMYLLRVTIIEARDILQMDPNGLSDPYCILTMCRKKGYSPNKLHQSNSIPENNSPLVIRKFGSPASSSSSSTCTPSSPAQSPSSSARNSPSTHSARNSPIGWESKDSTSLARRNATHNRSFRRRRRKSTSAGDNLHGGMSGDVASAGRMRSETEVDSRLASISSMEAECMMRTMCKKETLHPVWNETFDLEVSASNIELLELRLTMWDWDEETSLWEACKSLDSDHKMAGIKNIFRHVKGGINKSTDDYMGQVVVPLIDIPNATRVDKWYHLHHGKHISHHVGKVHLKLNFVRKQKSADELDDSTKLAHYHQLAMAVYKYEGQKHLKETGTPWDGKLSEMSQLVLNDYAVQRGIVKLSQQVINLTAMLSFHHQKSVPPRPDRIKTQLNFDEPDSAPSTDGPNPLNTHNVADSECIKPGHEPTTSAKKESVGPPILEMDPILYDRGIREATYNVHAETIALTSVSVYEGRTKTVREMYDNNPQFLEFEMGLAEMSVCAYVDLCLKTLSEVPPLFPSSGLDTLEVLQSKCKLQNIHTLLSMKVWKDTESAPHRLVRQSLTSTIKSSTRSWVNQQLSRLPQTEGNLKPHELTELLDKLGEVIGELCEVCKPNKDYKNFFMRYHIDYYQAVAQQVDLQISGCLGEVLSNLQQYQVRYQKFPENISQSSKASLKLYMMVKKLVQLLRQSVQANRDELQLYQFHTWFQEPLIFWLITFKEETFDRVHRALDMDKDVVLVHQVVKYSNSAVDVQACFAKVTEEWQKIGFEGPHPRCVAITKITESICEGAKLYANRVHWILEENGFYKEGKEAQFDIKDKLCITLNNIEHVRVYLDNLPNLLEWNKNIQELAKEHNDLLAGNRTLDTLHRLTTNASKDVLMMSSLLERKIAERMCREVSKYMDKVVNPNTNDEDYLDELLGYIDNQLETLYKQLLPQIFPRIVDDLWEEILSKLMSLMQVGKPPMYYHELRGSLESLEAYFQRPGISLSSSQVKTKEYVHLDNQLQLNSKTTHELMMEYYKQLASDVSTPMEYLGHVGIKMIYVNEPRTNETKDDDSSKETCTIAVKVCNAVALPGMDRSGLSDPYVIVEVLPETTLAERKVCQTKIKEQTLAPTFNETFQFDDIPVSAVESGAVIGLTIMDHDFIVPDDFIGEVFYPLKLAQRVWDLQTIDNASVVMLAIKRPQACNSGAFEVVRNRSQWDHHAKQFLAKRTRAIEKQKKRTDTHEDKPSTFTHLALSFLCFAGDNDDATF